MTENIRALRGKPYPMGAYVLSENSVNISTIVIGGNSVMLNLIPIDDKSNGRIISILLDDTYRLGNIYCVLIEGISVKNYRYVFESESKTYLDFYVNDVYGNEDWGRYNADNLIAGFYLEEYDWEGDVNPKIDYEDSVMYLIHVRGFTMHSSSKSVYRGSYRGVIDKLDYLQELGITSLILMPSYEFLEMEKNEVEAMDMKSAASRIQDYEYKPINYWGYKEGYYLSPKKSYSYDLDAINEFKSMVKSIHSRGMELIMQFYFPSYVTQSYILNTIKYWVDIYHVDGFQLLGENIPIKLLLEEPMLADTKLIYQGMSRAIDRELGDAINIYRSDIDDHYMYDMRRWLKGDENSMQMAFDNILDPGEASNRINYITGYYGFTLADLVSYDRKHNEANHENGNDGILYNCSWNCGVEGPTKRVAINKLRLRQMKNACIILLLSRGTPMIRGGDEFGHTQSGNNNPYCQDNAISWLNWRLSEKNKELVEFIKGILRFRKENRILTSRHVRVGNDKRIGSYPAISLHGEQPWVLNIDGLTRDGAILYHDDNNDRYIYIIYNMHWIDHEYALPKIPSDRKWHWIADTFDACKGFWNYNESEIVKDKIIVVKERSIVVLASY